jgi:hypothetical protein
MVDSFNYGLWQKEMLVGSKLSDAAFVVCNGGEVSGEVNNGPAEQAARKLKVRIGLAAVHAAEFIPVTIEQDTRAADAAR